MQGFNSPIGNKFPDLDIPGMPGSENPPFHEDSTPPPSASTDADWEICAKAVAVSCPQIAWNNRNFAEKKERAVLQGIMLHAPASAGISSTQLIQTQYNRYYARPEENLCMNAVIDGTQIIQVLPWTFTASHCHGDMDQTHVGIILNIPPAQDRANYISLSKAAYETAVTLTAHLCQQFHLNPLAETEGQDNAPHCSTILSPLEACLFFKNEVLDFDLEAYWETLKPELDYSMDSFRKAVSSRISSKA